MKKVDSIMLIDDHEPTNMIHEMIIKNNNFTDKILTYTDAAKALDYLKGTFSETSSRPSIIFLDINMPGMDGWDFLKEYEKLDEKSEVMIMMLSTSLHPQDSTKAKENSHIKTFLSKPLTKEMIEEIINDNF